MAERITKNEKVFMLSLFPAHALLWWLGGLIPVINTPLEIVKSTLIVAFPAIACTSFYLGFQEGRLLCLKGIWMCLILPVAEGALISWLSYIHKSACDPGCLDVVIIPVYCILNLVCACILILVFTFLRNWAARGSKDER